MSSIQGKNTKPEILVRKGLNARGFRFRLHNKKLPGSPDIVLPKYGVVIMVNACFWHGHKGCRYATKPKTNVEFWETKIASSHMARRTFIGNIYKLVKDPNLVSALTGHVEGSRAFSRYRTIDIDMKKDLVKILEGAK